MINLSNTAPPDTITVNGEAYPVNTDYRIWIQILYLIQDIDTGASGISQAENIKIICEINKLAFGKIIDQPCADVLNAVAVFLHGYPHEGNGSASHEAPTDNTKLYSFRHDLNYIILAIRNQSGIDLSYKHTEPFHWWLFLLEFQSLESRHYICELMRRRGYKGKDPELIKAREEVRLPPEYTRAEQRVIESLDDIFYNS